MRELIPTTGSGFLFWIVLVLFVGVFLGYFAQGRKSSLFRLLKLTVPLFLLLGILYICYLIAWVFFGVKIELHLTDAITVQNDTTSVPERFQQVWKGISEFFRGIINFWSGGGGKK